jgi:hypothetical protein
MKFNLQKAFPALTALRQCGGVSCKRVIMLFIPEKITIDLFDSTGKRFHQPNVLLQIHTHASRKNDIIIDPLITDLGGSISIEKSKIEEMIKAVMLSGLMDYVSIETAHPQIEIIYLGVKSINIRVKHIQHALIEPIRMKIWNFETQSHEFIPSDPDAAREDLLRKLRFYQSSYNYSNNVVEDILLRSDSWHTPQVERKYTLTLDFV